MWTFVNLFMVIGIIAIIIAMKMHIKWWNWVLALLSTLVIVVVSAFMPTSSAYAYGAYLMLTLPMAPVAFLVLWLLFAITDWLGKFRGGQQHQPNFGRSPQDE